MVLPPLDAGADQARLTWPLLGVAVFSVGAPGTVRGVADRAFEAAPVPMAFVAVTVNAYDTPLVRPETVQLVPPVVVHVAPPGFAVAV